MTPVDLAFLWDNEEAYKLLNEVRWEGPAKCPRCRSTFTKEVNTSVFRELTRCRDCGYMFNQLSGTMFQGSKIPLVKYFQLFVAYDASEMKISSREVSYIIDVSDKTAQSLLGRLKKVKQHDRFTTHEHRAPDSQGDAVIVEVSAKHEAFFLYCSMKKIDVDHGGFKRFLTAVVSAD
ncbi:transposase [Rhizobium sp.]